MSFTEDVLKEIKANNAKLEREQARRQNNVVVIFSLLIAAMIGIAIWLYMPTAWSNHKEIRSLERRIEILESKTTTLSPINN